MIETSKISIITVVFNAKNTLEQTMLSVLRQTYSNVEYIIVDGASTDGTLDIITNYERRITNGEFPNVSFHYISEPDKGIYDAMNKGIKMSSGEWIGIINSGDGYKDGIFELVIDQASQNPKIELLFGNMKIIKDGVYLRDEVFNGAIDKKMMNICHPTVFVKKKVYDECGLFDERFSIAADYDLLLRFYRNQVKFVHINEFVANFATGGVSSNMSFQILKERFMIRKKNNVMPFSFKEVALYIMQKISLYKKNW